MENKAKNTKLQDEARLAHMIAWRDKRISALEDLLQAMEQADRIYAAYIAYLLERCGDKQGKILVSKAALREICGRYAVHAEDAGEHFLIMLAEKGIGHEAQCGKMADA